MNPKSCSLTEGPITKSIIAFSVPILLSNLFQQLYNSIDTAVVGTYAGSASLAAVGSTAALINLLIGFFLGIATGTGVLYAMYYGAGQYDRLKKLINSALFIAVAAGLFISILGIIFARQLLVMMDTPDDVIGLSERYLRIYLSGTVVNMIYNVAAGMIRAEGDSKGPLIYLVIGGVSNLVLDLFFVAVLNTGVDGAALATVIAQAISAVLCVIRLLKMPEQYRFRFNAISIDAQTCRELVRVSVPCGLQSSMFNISNLLVQAKINSFGSVAMAGIAAYGKIDGFVYMPMMAVSLAVSTYVGQNVGAGKYDRVRKGIRVCLLLAGALSVTMGSAVVLFADSILNLFTSDPEVKSIALRMMWFMAPFAWVFTFSDILGGAIRGAGETMKVTIITALCICVFRVVWLIVMLKVFYDIRVVCICYPISWTLCSIVMLIYYFKSPVMKKALRPRESEYI